MPANDVAISVQEISHTFGEWDDPKRVLAIEHVSLDVARGELLCLIGPSGCGKSTLLNIIGGLVAPSHGQVLIDGERVSGPRPKQVSYVFQEYALFPWSTVLDNVVVGMTFQGVSKAERAPRAWEALETVGLADFAHHYPGQLSGGMKQRVALARALALQTEIILMDEPFGALDEQTRMILGEELSVLLARTGKTIIFVTHSLGESVFLSDRVAVFSARPGVIKEILSVDEPHPRSPGFMAAERFNALRNELYAQLHDEIRRSMQEFGATAEGAGAGR